MKGIHPSPATGIIPAGTLTGKLDQATGNVRIDFPRTEAASTPEARENVRVISEVLDELYFKAAMVPGLGYFDAGINLATNVIPGCSTVEFTKAGGPVAWRTEWRRRARWRNAAARVTITYSAAVGSANAFHLDLRTRESAAGDVHIVPNILAAAIVIPGPAVAFAEMSYTYVSPGVAINGAKPTLTLAISRNPVAADDTNANSLHILSVEWEIIPL